MGVERKAFKCCVLMVIGKVKGVEKKGKYEAVNVDCGFAGDWLFLPGCL